MCLRGRARRSHDSASLRRSGGGHHHGGGGADAWVHIPWSLLYVCAGSMQIIAGIFYFMSLPVFRLGSNIYTGCWNVVAGIGGGMLACVGPYGARRHEVLLYVAVTVLAVNIINLLVLELGEWKHLLPESARRLLEQSGFRAPAQFARLTTSLSSAVTAVAAFIETQLAFCVMNCCSPDASKRRRKDGHHTQDQGSDVEYIIPRPKSDSVRKSSNNIQTSYAQSWVFDSEVAGPQLNNNTTTASSTPSMMTSSGPSTPMNGGNPALMLQEASTSEEGSDRQMPHMASFSRPATPSPAPSMEMVGPAPIYEYLERLTGPAVYRARLDTAISIRRDDVDIEATSPRPSSRRACEEVQYASLMAELQQSLVDKKIAKDSPEGTSESLTTSDDKTASKSSRDAEFSRELEAALQLIQELETPSEPCAGPPGQELPTSGSEKTLSAAGSLAELTSPGPTPLVIHHGKGLPCDSQSTSGYSSPSHPYTPTPKRYHPHRGYCIRESNASAVISLFPRPSKTSPVMVGKSVTLLNVGACGELTVATASLPTSHHSSTETLRAGRSPSGESSWNVRSLLRKKKTSVPKLSPELEAAIIKSESLAYLTDVELLARHERNRQIQRKIEKRVQRQLSNGGIPVDARVSVTETTR